MIGISTGVFYKAVPEEDLNKTIDLIRPLDIDEVEILYARPFIMDATLSQKNLTFLKKIKVTIHAPFFKDQGWEDAHFDKHLLDKVVAKAKELGARHIIIHPDLVDLSLLKAYDCIFALENLKSKRGFGADRLKQIFKENPKLKLSLDIGHARDWGPEELPKLLQNFKDRIVEIQFSVDDHYENVLQGKSYPDVELVRTLNVPLVLESRPTDIKLLPPILELLREKL
ncbi:MAG: hypothetical protein AABX70_05725 [Nanoarchaeota archaeon]